VYCENHHFWFHALLSKQYFPHSSIIFICHIVSFVVFFFLCKNPPILIWQTSGRLLFKPVMDHNSTTLYVCVCVCVCVCVSHRGTHAGTGSRPVCYSPGDGATMTSPVGPTLSFNSIQMWIIHKHADVFLFLFNNETMWYTRGRGLVSAGCKTP